MKLRKTIATTMRGYLNENNSALLNSDYEMIII